MGYQLQSIFGVSKSDQHSYFVYYIPPSYRRFELMWIDAWFARALQDIASSIGPEGVIVAPLPKHGEKYLTELLSVNSGGCFFDGVFTDITGKQKSWEESESDFGVLHSGLPFLIIAKTPIQPDGDSVESVRISLAAYTTEQELAVVIDRIISVVKTGVWEDLKSLPPQTRHEMEDPVWPGLIKIEPNVFGLGFNFNLLLKKLAIAITKKRK